jgi:hypothetical protein
MQEVADRLAATLARDARCAERLARRDLTTADAVPQIAGTVAAAIEPRSQRFRQRRHLPSAAA